MNPLAPLTYYHQHNDNDQIHETKMKTTEQKRTLLAALNSYGVN